MANKGRWWAGMWSKKRKVLTTLLFSSAGALGALVIPKIVLTVDVHQGIEQPRLQMQHAAANINAIDGFLNAQLRAHSGWEFKANQQLLLKQLVQFRDNQFVNQPLLVTNHTFANWYKNYFLNLEINVDNPYGEQISGQLVYRDEATNHKRALGFQINHLKPLISANLTKAVYQISQSQFGALTLNQFWSNPDFYLQQLIKFNAGVDEFDPNYLISTNAKLKDLEQLKLKLTPGQIDWKQQAIINNEISFLVPEVNQINPKWDLNEDIFKTVVIKFDLVDFLKEDLTIDFESESDFSVENTWLAKQDPLTIDRNFFLNHLVNYQSNYLVKPQLVATNANRLYFETLIEDYRSDFNNGFLTINLKLKNHEPQKWTLWGWQGSVKIINPEVIDLNQYQFANQAWYDAFNRRDEQKLRVLVGDKIASIFYDVFQINGLDNISPATIVDDFSVAILPTLGFIKVDFNIKPEYGKMSVNGAPARQIDQISIALKVRENRAKIVFVKEAIMDRKAYDLVDDWINQFVRFEDPSLKSANDQTVGQKNSDGNFLWLTTNLTRQEFLAITNVKIETDPANRLALLTLNLKWFDDEQALATLSVISNRKPIGIENNRYDFDANTIHTLSNFSVDDFNEQSALNLINFNNQSLEDYGIKINVTRNLFERVLLRQVILERSYQSVQVHINYWDLTSSDNNVKAFNFQVFNLKTSLKLVAISASLSLAIVILGLLLWWTIVKTNQSRIKLKIIRQQQYLKDV